MKFEKFLKSLGGHGIIYNKGNERWLSSASVLAKIPENMIGVIAEKAVDMPETIAHFIDYDMSNDACELYKTVMPLCTGTIKDCVRIYSTENNGVHLPISNDDYSLISKSDITEIQSKWNNDTESFEPKALVIRAFAPNPEEDAEIIGIIFPIVDFNE